ncbi:MAG: tetratricopeptide repeat protein [Planctomycetota bacterium]
MNPHTQRGLLLYQQSRYEQAEKELGFALSQDPEDAWAYGLMGACRAAAKKFDEAVELGNQAVSLAPDDSDIRYLLAQIHFRRNDLDVAEKTIDAAVGLDPEQSRYYALRAAIRATRKQWGAVLNDCETALELDPQNTTAINLKAQAQRGIGVDAADDLEHALRVNPEDPYSHANVGWQCLEKGELAKAEKHFREALRLDPDLEWARVGALETLKARVPPYRWVLNYFLWMSKKTAGAQWKIIIGFYILHRVLQSVTRNNPALEPLAAPLLAAYLTFCVVTWFAKPLSDAALLLHPFGRLALSKDERRAALTVGGLFATTALLALVSFAGGGEPFGVLAAFVGIPGLPLAFSFSFSHPKPRKILRVSAAVVALCGVPLLIETFATGFYESLPDGFRNGLFNVAFVVFGLSPFATMVGTNILATKEWRE